MGMVNNQAARQGGLGGDSFADDDPLAELARIVGYEQPVASPVREDAAPPRQARVEPAFDLEDELLREFETYRAPQPAAPAFEPEPELEIAPDDFPVPDVSGDADWHAQHAAEPRVEAVEPELTGYDAPTYEEPRFEHESPETPLADEPMFAQTSDDRAGYDVRGEEPRFEDQYYEDQQADAELVSGPAYADERLAEDARLDDLAFEGLASNHEAHSQDHEPRFDVSHDDRGYEPVALDEQLVGELEMAISDTPENAAPEIPAEERRDRSQTNPRLSLPLANFPAVAGYRRPEPQAAAIPEPATVAQGRVEPEFTLADEPRIEDADLSFSAVDTRSLEDELAGFGDEDMQAVETPRPSTREDDFAVDIDLADELDAFVQPEPPASAEEGLDFVVPEPEPVAAAPVVANVETRLEPDFAMDLSDTRGAEQPVEEPVAARVSEPEAPIQAKAEDSPDPFVDTDFDLSLDEIELDLSEFADEVQVALASPEPRGDVDAVSAKPTQSEPQADAVVAPVAAAAAAAVVQSAYQPRYQLPGRNLTPEPSRPAAPPTAARPVTTPTLSQPMPAATIPVTPPAREPVAVQASFAPTMTARSPVPTPPAPSRPVQAAQPAKPAEPRVYEPLPFDPSQIAEQDEMPSTIPALQVPDLPSSEPAGKIEYPPEYDIDIDAELASMFENTPIVEPTQAPAPVMQAASAAAARTAQAANQSPTPAPQSPEDFDAFERALEEDFRDTLDRSNGREAPRPTRVTLQEEDFSPAPEKTGRRWLLPASVAAVALLAVGGGYAFMNGSGSSMLSSGEPPVILADKDPVKMVPEDRGGTAVPNQDKAVYDRVQGAVENPTQPNLNSSNEEPVDVVQRTLMPESLPLEGEDDGFLPTPVGETEDPRLLPGEQTASGDTNARTGGDPESVAIAPRRVRTMIVRADGTLVAQEVPEQTEAAATAPAVQAPVAELAAPASQTVATVTPAPVATTAVPDTPAQPVSAAQSDALAAAASGQAASPVPAARPQAAAPAAPVETPVAPPATETAAVTPAVETPAAAPANPGGYFIQIASLPSQAEAQRSYQNLSSRYGSVIGGKGVDIKSAQIEGRGTYYRVRIPAGDRAQANQMCEQYRAAGGSCIVAR